MGTVVACMLTAHMRSCDHDATMPALHARPIGSAIGTEFNRRALTVL